jgi:hypothetical protein
MKHLVISRGCEEAQISIALVQKTCTNFFGPPSSSEACDSGFDGKVLKTVKNHRFL